MYYGIQMVYTLLEVVTLVVDQNMCLFLQLVYEESGAVVHAVQNVLIMLVQPGLGQLAILSSQWSKTNIVFNISQ